MSFVPGDHVRVIKPVQVFNHPQFRNQNYSLEGHEGEVDAVFLEWQGRPLSANFPYRVRFADRYKAHLSEDELEALPSAPAG
ncbi:MAG: ferredoxin-thioredoxin reductase variable chain [Gemmatimonadaceae bacterium]|nr:ferredoxin-thioredoxin reductase variable chain [Gloeobacterales cyanobacterium ES-bin-141]